MWRWLVVCCCLASTTVAAQTIDAQVLRALQEAQVAQSQGKLARAKSVLETLKPAAGSLEQALVWRQQGYLAWLAGRPARAIERLELALNSGQLNPEQLAEDRLSLAKLLVQQQRNQAALNQLKHLADNAEVLQLSIQAWQQLGRYDRALPLAERYLAQNKGALDEQWLQFMVAGNSQLKRYTAALPWQKQLLKRQPRHVEHWRQLATLQHLADDDAAAFATLRTAHTQRLLTATSDFEMLVNLALAAEQPWQGARLLEGFLAQKKLASTPARQEQLARLYWQARERTLAINHYQALAKQSNQAGHWMILVQLALETQQWQLGEQALAAAARAGARRQEVQAWQEWLNSSQEAAAVTRARVALR